MKHFILLVSSLGVLVASTFGAPPVYFVQPLVLANNDPLGTLQEGSQLVLNPTASGKVLLVTPERHHREDGEVEQYDEGVEESKDWKEEDESQTQKKEDYDNGQYVEGKKYEENENYNEKSNEESTTESKEDTGDYTEKTETEDDSGKYDKNDDEEEGHEGSGLSGQYIEQSTEETNWDNYSNNESENREGKSAEGGEEVKNDGSENDSKNKPEEHNGVSDTNSENKSTEKADNSAVQLVQENDKDSVGKVDNKDVKFIDPTKGDKPLHVPEEIVIGSAEKTQAEESKNKNTLIPNVNGTATDSKESLPVTNLNPSVKETEIVQLAPVVYHVSPKFLQLTPVQVRIV